MNFRDVMRYERSALLGESVVKFGFAGITLMPYAAVTKPEALVGTPSALRAMHPVRLESLPGKDRTAAFVQVCPSLQYKFLWVNASNNGYREDYKTFLQQVHHIAADLPGNLHADHLYNRKRAQELGTPFIRLVLLDGPINESHGAGYEKARTGKAFGASGRDHKLDEITLMKLCGIPSPKKGKPLTAEMMAHVHQVAQFYGMSPREIEDSINSLMDVARQL